MNAGSADIALDAVAQEPDIAIPACTHCGEPAPRVETLRVFDADGNVYAGEVGPVQGLTKFVPRLID